MGRNYKNLIRLFFVILLSPLVNFSKVASQTTDKTLAFNALSIHDGFSQGMVVRIFQDRYGLMWFATLDGVNCYDGYNFTVYRHDAHDQSSITESFAQCFYEDSQGRLWIGTISGGLDLFDRETETFIHIKHQQGIKTSLSPGPINSNAEHKDGKLWVQISNKLDKVTIINNQIDGTKRFFIEHINVPFKSESSFLVSTKSGNIYYVHASGGVVYKIDNSNINKWTVAVNVDDYHQQNKKTDSSIYRIVQLLEDTVQNKCYIFYDGGVIKFDETTGLFEKIFQISRVRYGFQGNKIFQFSTPGQAN